MRRSPGDEVFTADGLEGHAALDDQSAFIASLGSSRSERMRDVPAPSVAAPILARSHAPVAELVDAQG